MVALRAAGGFGDSTSGKKSEAAAKEAAEVKADDPKAALDADIEAMRSAMGASSKGSDTLQSFGESSMEPSVPEKQVSRNPGGKRAQPVNMDAGAVFDKDWLKNSFETVTSDEWRKSGTETVAGGEAVCPECKGTGRIAGGLSTLPGFDWWPIKAFRPCPTCEKEGREYQRRGQGLNEVLFGQDDMPINYERPTDLGAMASDDIKKIMAKGNRDSRRKAKKIKADKK